MEDLIFLVEPEDVLYNESVLIRGGAVIPITSETTCSVGNSYCSPGGQVQQIPPSRRTGGGLRIEII